MDFQNPSFWKEAWEKAKEDSPWRKRKELNDVLEHWERKAKSYSNDVLGKKNEKRVERTLSFLEHGGLTLEGMRILDIGAGPGSFSIPLAKKAREVVALEPVKGMVKTLEKRIKREGLGNIKIIEKAWESVDLREEGFFKGFDLAFASMSPGINNKETVEKALSAGREYCFFSSFAGRRENQAVKDLWPILFEEEIPSWPGDHFFLQNLLYSLGYDLSCRVWEERREEWLAREAAIHSILELLERWESKREDLKEVVEAYVVEHMESGSFLLKSRRRLGMILVNI